MAPLFTASWFNFGRNPSSGPGSPGVVATPPLGHDISGGVISEYTTPPGAVYRSHTFTTECSYTVNTLSSDYPAHLEFAIVGGGGSGGGDRGGGGGGGGVRTNSPVCEMGGPGNSKSPSTAIPIAAPNPYNIIINYGGFKGSYPQPGSPKGQSDGYPANPEKPMMNGPETTFTKIYYNGGSLGVGGGGGSSSGRGGGGNGAQGQSYPDPNGGGGGGSVHPGGTAAGGRTYGYASGTGGPGLGGSGGGGCTGEGGDSTGEGGIGGQGAECTMQGPHMTIYLGSGGGGGDNGPSGGKGGDPTPFYPGGWGGSGEKMPGQQPGQTVYSGVYGTGAGGGGASNAVDPMVGGDGAPGCVIIRYQIQASNKMYVPVKATGGQVSFYNNKIIHTFLYSQNFETTSAISGAEVFVLGAGGGGAGGNGGPGGGGAGGAVSITGVSFPSPIAYTVTIGYGGRGGGKTDTRGGQGQDSYISGPGPALAGNITGKGGGYGGNHPNGQGGPGGCAGGNGGPEVGSNQTPNQPTANPDWPTATAYGNNGGTHGPESPNTLQGGGGGGLGGAGSNGWPRKGGAGMQLPATFRDPRAALSLGTPGPGGSYYVGGGGSGGTENGAPGPQEGEVTPDSGGGGQSGGPGSYNRQCACPGLANTGGGGGGAWWQSPDGGKTGGDGGTGLVLIAYPDGTQPD